MGDGVKVLLVLGGAILGFFILSSVNVGSILPTPPKGSTSTDKNEKIDQGEELPDSLNDAISEEVESTIADIRDLKGELEKIENAANSKYKGIVRISRYSSARDDLPSEENIEISVSSKADNPIKITGWRLESAVSGTGVSIKQGTYLPYSAQVNTELDIFLNPGESAIITTGRSPIGTSFRLNLCTGYFEQFQNFDPRIRLSCPRPIDELPNLGPGLEFERCYDFVRRMDRCEVYLEELPLNVGGACLNFITEKLNYNSCVSNHKDDPGFYFDEWRIFLGRNNELWKQKRELIKLIDNEGKVVDAVTY